MLSGNIKISDASIQLLIRLKYLKHLGLADLPLLTDTSLNILSLNLKGLISINISNSKLVTGKGIVDAIKNLPRLKQLNLSNCPIKDEDIKTVNSHLPNLTSLDVSECKHLSIANLLKISELKHLIYLNVKGCDLVDDQKIAKALKLKRTRLEQYFLKKNGI